MKYVCAKHFEDKNLHNYVTRKGEKGECNYCEDGKEKRVIDISELGEFIQECLLQSYDDAGNWLPFESQEGGYQGSTNDTRDLIEDHLDGEVDNKVLNDLIYEIDDKVWCRDDPFGDSRDELLMKDWENFKTIIQHHQRFTIFQSQQVKIGRFKTSATEILKELGKMIQRFQMIKTLPSGTIVYRCRQHEKDDITDASQMCSPSKQYALYPNRMSPAGISMFYGSFNKNTSECETINMSIISEKPYCTTAAFSTKEDIWVVDFSKLPKKPSIFNPRQFSKFHWVSFLNDFVTDLSREILKDDKSEHIEYTPTQAVTEYIRYILKPKGKKQVMGMIYPSSKDPNKNCLVLFYNHEESLEKMEFLHSCLSTRKLSIDKSKS